MLFLCVVFIHVVSCINVHCGKAADSLWLGYQHSRIDENMLIVLFPVQCTKMHCSVILRCGTLYSMCVKATLLMTLFTQGILYCHLCRAVFKHTRMHRCSVHPICRQSHWCNLGHNDSMATVLSPYMTSVVMHGPERRPCEYVLWERGLVCSKWTAPQQAGACNRNAKMCPKPRLCHLRSAGPEAHSWEWAALSAEMQVKKSWTPFFFF